MRALFLKNEEQPREKTSEQCFLVNTKPTCQNPAIFEHFQKWQKKQGDVLAHSPSIVHIVKSLNLKQGTYCCIGVAGYFCVAMSNQTYTVVEL